MQRRMSTGHKDGGQMRSPLVVIESFLTVLISIDKHGRIAISKAGEVGTKLNNTVLRILHPILLICILLFLLEGSGAVLY